MSCSRGRSLLAERRPPCPIGEWTPTHPRPEKNCPFTCLDPRRTLDNKNNTAIFKIMARRSKQLEMKFRSHGGARAGAGRKPTSVRPPVHHVKRPKVPCGSPAHVTLRVHGGVPSLRTRRFAQEFQARLRQGCERGEFRVCHYS